MTTSHPTDTTASGQKKFLFDREFDMADAPAPPMSAKEEPDATPSDADVKTDEIETEEVIVPTFSEDDLAQARMEGHAAGRDEATRDMSSALEQRLANLLETLNTQLENLFRAYAQDQETHSRDAVSVATVIVRKLFPTLTAANTMIEIEHIVTEAMKRTSASPALMIKVPEDMHQDIKSKITELAVLHGRADTITIMAKTEMAPGDISIEWDGGGMTRDTALMWREIDQIIERNLGPSLKADHDTMEPSDQPATETSPPAPAQDSRQEVVKPGAVGENEDAVTESQKKPKDPQHENEDLIPGDQ